jgi:hypothetical protein
MVSRTGQENAPKNEGKAFGSATNIFLALIALLISAGSAVERRNGSHAAPWNEQERAVGIG